MTGTHPFTVSGFTTAAIVQQPDALAVTGMPQGNDVYAGLSMPFVVGSVRVAMGIDVTAVNSGAPSGQNQIALAIHAAPPNYFVELNQNLPTFDVASVTYYDGNNFTQADARDLATGIHTGPLFLQTTQTVGTGVVLDVGWPGELYRAQVLDNLYQGATDLEINLNNVNLEIRYLLVITSP